MKGSRRAEEGFASTEKEILAEKAAALSRIARTLEAHVDRLRMLREELTHLDGAARASARARYLEERRAALQWRWYLVVQREAMGLVRHDGLDELYPIAPAPD